LTRQIAAKNAYEFYYLFRRHCESGKTSKKTSRKKKTSAQKTDDTPQQAKDAENKVTEASNVG
jgi:hypothetical protein